MKSNLTARQSKFVAEYSLSHCAADAARKAGYSPKTARQMASENLSKPYVVAALRLREDAQAQELDLTRGKVLMELQEAIAVAKLKGDAAAMISGWREIGKMCGFYSPERHKVEVNDRGREYLQRMESLSEAELLAIICAEPVD